MDDKLDEIIEQREKTHGSYARQSYIAQSVKQDLRGGESYHLLTEGQLEAIDMICVKLARIVCGDPMQLEHWIDTAGYATLGGKSIVTK